MIHELKTWPEYYSEVLWGNKKFEVRKNDRKFQVNDVLLVKEYDPYIQEYTHREMTVKVDYILDGGSHGLEEGYVIMSITKIK